MTLIDSTDFKILEILKENSRVEWKSIGERVHMTGQAVAARIRRMEEVGVIQAFTILIDEAKLGKPVVFYVIVYMISNDHKMFQSFIKSSQDIIEAHRTSGGGCYLIKANVASNEDLKRLLDEIIKYGNYDIILSIDKIK